MRVTITSIKRAPAGFITPNIRYFVLGHVEGRPADELVSFHLTKTYDQLPPKVGDEVELPDE